MDTDLQIRRFTPRATEIIPLTATDRGRPIKDLASQLIESDLAEYGQLVLADLAVREIEVDTEDERSYVLRVRPYRTTANLIDGVVITFDDITERKRAERIRQESEQRYRTLYELTSDSIVLIDAQTGAIVEFNRKAYEHLGYTREEFAKLGIPDIEAAESAKEFAEHLKDILNEGALSLRPRTERSAPCG